jgi:hypothetical protein
MAVKQRAAAQAVVQAEETRTRVHEHLDNPDGEPAQRGLSRPPKAAATLEQVAQDVEAARHEQHRLAGQRETVTQSHPRHRLRLPLCRLGARRASQRPAHCW